MPSENCDTSSLKRTYWIGERLCCNWYVVQLYSNQMPRRLCCFADHNEVRKKIGKIIIHYDPTERRVIGTAVANFTASKVKSFTNTCLSGVKWVENLYESTFKRSHVQSVMGIFTAIITIATIYLYIVIIFTILLLLILLLWLSLLLINLPPCLYGTEGP